MEIAWDLLGLFPAQSHLFLWRRPGETQTREQLAEALGISRRALAYKKNKDPELFHTLKAAKAQADARVEKALFERATGYICEDCHVSQFKGKITVTPLKKHYPPDVTACIFWLKNRKPQEWRDRGELKKDEVLVAVPPDVLERLREQFMECVACPESNRHNGSGS